MQSLQRKIKVIGDSILKGVQVDSSLGRYVVNNNIEFDGLSREFGLEIENCSRFGCTVTKAYEVTKRMLEKDSAVYAALMDFGGNDCDFKWSEISENPNAEHECRTPLALFVETYKSLIELLRNRGIKPILTTLPPIAPEKYFNWFCIKENLNKENVMSWLGDVNAIYRYQENYSHVVTEIAKEKNVDLIDIRSAFLEHRKVEAFLCEDGIHPNTAGQELISRVLRNYAVNRIA